MNAIDRRGPGTFFSVFLLIDQEGLVRLLLGDISAGVSGECQVFFHRRLCGMANPYSLNIRRKVNEAIQGDNFIVSAGDLVKNMDKSLLDYPLCNLS